MKKRIKHLLLFMVLITLITCKKYPENNLWFKNPEKLKPLNGYLTAYNVNGIDSLTLLNTYYGTTNGLIKDITQAKFSTLVNKGRVYCSIIYGGGLSQDITYGFDKTKKYIFINQNPSIADSAFYKKNLFISKDTKMANNSIKH